MARPLEITVDASCIGSGYCRRALPDVFGADETRKAVVQRTPVEESEQLWEAMEGCPVEAIAARDAATGEVVFP